MVHSQAENEAWRVVCLRIYKIITFSSAELNAWIICGEIVFYMVIVSALYKGNTIIYEHAKMGNKTLINFQNFVITRSNKHNTLFIL